MPPLIRCPGRLLRPSLLRALGRSVLAGSHYALAPDKPCSNASLRFDREGRIAGRHDKPHFVDIGLANQPNYREFGTAGGNRVVTADIGGAVASLSVCHIRFPEF